MSTILLVEDDPVLSRSVQINLETEGYKVFKADSIRSAFQANQTQKINLVILDLGLPDGSGFDFLSKLRDAGSRLPVIILTAQVDEDSVVNGLQLGANDYMKKPFGQRELLARIKAVLREPLTREKQIRFEDVLILVDQRKVLFQERSIELNRREFDILLYFFEHAENIVSREALLNIFDKDGEIFDRTVDSHVSHVRSKLKTAGVTHIKISSVYGIGYRLEKKDD